MKRNKQNRTRIIHNVIPTKKSKSNFQANAKTKSNINATQADWSNSQMILYALQATSWQVQIALVSA